MVSDKCCIFAIEEKINIRLDARNIRHFTYHAGSLDGSVAYIVPCTCVVMLSEARHHTDV